MTHTEVGGHAVNLPAVAIGVGVGVGRGVQLAVGDLARVPVCPEDLVALDVDIHGVDSHVLVSPEGLLVGGVGVEGVNAADLVIVRDVQHLVCRSWGRE